MLFDYKTDLIGIVRAQIYDELWSQTKNKISLI